MSGQEVYSRIQEVANELYKNKDVDATFMFNLHRVIIESLIKKEGLDEQKSDSSGND